MFKIKHLRCSFLDAIMNTFSNLVFCCFCHCSPLQQVSGKVNAPKKCPCLDILQLIVKWHLNFWWGTMWYLPKASAASCDDKHVQNQTLAFSFLDARKNTFSNLCFAVFASALDEALCGTSQRYQLFESIRLFVGSLKTIQRSLLF